MGTLNFVWKLPSIVSCFQDKQKEAKNISEVYDKIPVYSTRQMRKNVIQKVLYIIYFSILSIIQNYIFMFNVFFFNL